MNSLKVHNSGVYANMQAKAEKANVCDGCGGTMEYVRNIGELTWRGNWVEYQFAFLCRDCFGKFIEVMKTIKCCKGEK